MSRTRERRRSGPRLPQGRGLPAPPQAPPARASSAAAAREIRYWSARRATARIVPASTDVSQARFGATVTIVRDDGRKQTSRLVGEDEADPAKGASSPGTPLARAMLGKSVGDVVKAGNHEAEITSIE